MLLFTLLDFDLQALCGTTLSILVMASSIRVIASWRLRPRRLLPGSSRYLGLGVQVAEQVARFIILLVLRRLLPIIL